MYPIRAGVGKSAENGWLQAYTYFSFVYIFLALSVMLAQP
jgi:hypothetical protein